MKKIMGRNISIIYRVEHHYVDFKLKDFEINKVQAEVLIILQHKNGCNQNELNETFLFNKANITKIIKQLEKREYIERIASEEDKRAKGVYLTQKGRDILPQIIEILDEWTSILTKDIPTSDIKTVEKALAKMVENITEN